jgi:hypothetical protein
MGYVGNAADNALLRWNDLDPLRVDHSNGYWVFVGDSPSALHARCWEVSVAVYGMPHPYYRAWMTTRLPVKDVV